MKNRLFYLLLTFCSISGFSQDKLQIKGNIKGIPNDAKIAISANGTDTVIEHKGGVFEVALHVDDAPNNVGINILYDDIDKYTVFFLGNESVSITGSIEDFDGDIKAIGSKYDGVRYEHEMLNRELIREAGLLEDEVVSLIQKGAPRDSIDRIYYQKEEPKGKLTIVWEKKEKQDYDFLKKKINTAYGRSMLLYISDEVTREELKELFNLVESQYKQAKEVQYLKAKIDYDKLIEGAKYHDFKAFDWDGKLVKFSSYFNKGKYVLLDFSTMHCGYCQMAAPQTAKLAEEMKDKLTYVTYYIDTNKDIMKQYYELKGNKGILLWNKEGRSHPVNVMYSQAGTPHYVLLDTTGKVVTILSEYSENTSERLKTFIN